MDDRIKRRMHAIVRKRGMRPERALEVGGYVGSKSLLRFPEVAQAERWCINLIEQPDDTGITHVVGNANHMPKFDDGMFDLVMSNAMLEHDPRFWLSIAEMRRVLAPGGLLVIGVPGFVPNPAGDSRVSTDTYRVHTPRDYYRFSRRAVREVFLEDMDEVRVSVMLSPPRMVGSGLKPG